MPKVGSCLNEVSLLYNLEKIGKQFKRAEGCCKFSLRDFQELNDTHKLIPNELLYLPLKYWTSFKRDRKYVVKK